MAEVATAYVTLLPSARGFARGIQGEIGGDLRTAGTRGGKDYAGGMKAGVAGMASTVFKPLAIAAAALGIGKILSDSITAGSDLQQAIGAGEAVFKGQFEQVDKAAKNAATTIGLSREEYQRLATLLGAGLKNQGIKDFADQSQSLLALGGDLAAQFGGPTSDAIGAISAVMRGEYDTIERYGISLGEQAVNAELAAKGQGKLKGAALAQAKAQARIAIITRQSADAQGAFAREADTYAGSQQRLAASWDNIKTQVGTALLPALTDLSKWFLEKGLPAVKQFGGWVKDELWPALKDGWETVRPGLERAREILDETFGGESGDALREFGRIITDKVIPAISTIVNVWLPAAALQFSLLVDAIRAVGAFFELQVTIARKFFSFIIDGFVAVTNTAADMLEKLSVVPGFGWAKDAADKLRGVADKAGEVKDAINGIPTSRRIEIIAQVSMPGRITLPDGSNVNVGLRAKGGPVKAGQPYIVGERGPELVIPSRSGNVIPNHEAFGSGSAAALQGGGRFDYVRMGQAMADAVRQAPLAVGVEPVTRAVNRQNATVGRY